MFKELNTQRLFFWQCKRDIGEGRLSCPADVAVHLGALALQALGDYVSDSATKNHLMSERMIPDTTLDAFAHSIDTVVEKVNSEYQRLAGMTEASAVLGYMTIVQRLQAYGQHYYEVTSEADGLKYYLGIGPHGIAQYDFKDTATPRKSWDWLSLENVFWKKTRFELELLELPEGSVVDGEEARVKAGHVWLTSGASQSEQMLKQVQFQHQSSLAYERAKRTSRLTSLSIARDSRSTAPAFAASPPRHATPAAVEVVLPSNATRVHALLTPNSADAVSSPAVKTFKNSPSAPLPDVEDKLAPLHRLERRRDQLIAEIKWHRKLLDQCNAELENHMPSIRANMRSSFRRIAARAGKAGATASVFRKSLADAEERLAAAAEQVKKNKHHGKDLHPEGRLHVSGDRESHRKKYHGKEPHPRGYVQLFPHGEERKRTWHAHHGKDLHATGKVQAKIRHAPAPGSHAKKREDPSINPILGLTVAGKVLKQSLRRRPTPAVSGRSKKSTAVAVSSTAPRKSTEIDSADGSSKVAYVTRDPILPYSKRHHEKEVHAEGRLLISGDRESHRRKHHGTDTHPQGLVSLYPHGEERKKIKDMHHGNDVHADGKVLATIRHAPPPGLHKEVRSKPAHNNELVTTTLDSNNGPPNNPESPAAAPFDEERVQELIVQSDDGDTSDEVSFSNDRFDYSDLVQADTMVDDVKSGDENKANNVDSVLAESDGADATSWV